MFEEYNNREYVDSKVKAIAKGMLAEGFDNEIITKLTDLTVDEIEALKTV